MKRKIEEAMSRGLNERKTASNSAGLDRLVERILSSDVFRTAPGLRTLLQYLWKHRGEGLSEYAIAVDALGRPTTFDPKTDATVRVQVGRLRARLKEFYDEAGAAFPLRLTVPVGSHELRWTQRNGLVSILWSVPVFYRGILLGAGSAMLLLLPFVTFLQHRNARTSVAGTLQPLPKIWQLLVSGGKSTAIVVPSPTYFLWPEERLIVRDLNVSNFQDWPMSTNLRDLAARLGPPRLDQTYVSAVSMIAGTRLLQYLERHQHHTQLIASQSFSAESFEDQNKIFLGIPRTATYLQGLLERTNFYFAAPDLVVNRQPKAAEAKEFKEVSYSPDRRVAPAIIILLPPTAQGTRTLMLIGSPAIPTYVLLSYDGQKLLNESWVKAGSPDAWEMVIQGELNRGAPLKAWPVAFRSIPQNFWRQ